jgi:molybdate transport system substrate-binding protein
VAIVVAVVLLLTLATPVAAQELTLSVAISMKEAVEEVGRAFAAARPGVRLTYNLGSSGELQRQIEAGAPVDVFVSAAPRQMDELERKGLLVAGSRRVVARGALTVVKPADATLDLSRPEDLLGPRVRRIAIGNPRTVPAGQYARQSLTALGLWDRLQPKLVFAENVRQVLEYVARGEVEAGYVYVTDLARRPGPVREAFRPAEETYDPVLYPAAVVRGSRHPALGAAFIELLLAPAGRHALARLGFQPPAAPRRP